MKQQNYQRETTLEGKIVSDVDMCDALGAKTIYKCEEEKINHHPIESTFYNKRKK